MAHLEQRDFFIQLRALIPEAFTGVKVLEIGSLNVNGTVRDLFESDVYVGVDVASGPGVDVVALGEELDYPDDSFDVAVSAECFEHNPEWAATFQNMWRISSGHVIVTCATEGRPEHGTRRSEPAASPLTLEWDYYQNLTAADFDERFELGAMFDHYFFEENKLSHDLYFYGRKKG